MGKDERISFTFVSAISCSVPHSKVTYFSRHRSGAVMLNIFGICTARKLIIPNNHLMPALFVGGVISIYYGLHFGWIWLGTFRSNKGCMVFDFVYLIIILWRLKTMLRSFALSNTCVNMWLCSWLFLAAIIISSATLWTPKIPANASSCFFWNTSLAGFDAKGILVKWY